MEQEQLALKVANEFCEELLDYYYTLRCCLYDDGNAAFSNKSKSFFYPKKKLNLAKKENPTNVICGEDDEQVISLLKQETKNGNTEAMYALGLIYSCRKNDDEQSVYWYEQAAKNGYGEAMAIISLHYRLKDDKKQAISWAEKAENAENAHGIGVLAKMCIQGLLTSRDREEGLELLQEAAQKGSEFSMYDLGVCYRDGFLLKKDTAQGFYWLIEAAKKGFLQSIKDLAGNYHYGLRGAPKDEKQAAYWYEKGTKKGDIESMVGYADCIKEDNTDEAIRWLKEAAKNKNTDAMIDLALIYADKNDEKETNHWLENAAKHKFAVEEIKEVRKIAKFEGITVCEALKKFMDDLNKK